LRSGTIEVKVYLRGFSGADLSSVYELACQTLSERYDPGLFTTVSSSWPEGFLVVKSQQGIKAFLLGAMTSQIQSRVLMLAVSGDLRRRGVGTMLMSRFMEESYKKGTRVVTLEVRKNNDAALSFYNKLGFRRVDVIKNYYNDGEDAYQMQRWL
jgi:ribosomal-protein-alanine N-acetyltransferase